jgi:hypothetical protein
LNIDVAGTYTSTINCPSNLFFDILISGVKVDEGIFLTKLSFFHHYAMNLSDVARSPLRWWKEHVRLYPNVAFLARQILAILGS